MKIQHLIPILFLAAFCTVSAQTPNTTANTNAPALLTTNQAEALAIRLVNEKYIRIYEVDVTNKTDVFGTNAPDVVSKDGIQTIVIGATHIQTRFADGRWISTFQRLHPPIGIFIATVEIAPDGLTNAVELNVKYAYMGGHTP